MNVQAMDYSIKDATYFSAPRSDIVAVLPVRRGARILEIGCGTGATGKLALAGGKAEDYVGIEIDPASAEAAGSVLTKVVLGNVEALDLEPLGMFDVLIMSEVLEHLTDPWSTLKRAGRQVRSDGLLYCSSPNVASKTVIANLLKGRFAYEDSGIFDRTHIRWFTPDSFCQMVEAADFRVNSCQPIAKISRKWQVLHGLTGGRFRHLSMTQIFVIAQKR
jgi:2-polyprenyl-3-methyl-5-hydroxy-6-metoxy-1,4-benzoquinol methylase